jgi:hypothetical protein
MDESEIRSIARLRARIRREAQALYDVRLAAEGIAAFPILYLFVSHVLRQEWPLDLIAYAVITYLVIVFVIRPVAASYARRRAQALQDELAGLPEHQIEELLLPLRSDRSAETRAFVAPLLRKFGLQSGPRQRAAPPPPGNGRSADPLPQTEPHEPPREPAEPEP